MGDAGAGKSTTIRSLTGLGRSRRIWRIRTENNEDINVYVRINALQEDKYIKTVDKLLVSSNGCENILAALQIVERARVKGSGYYHIQQFIERGCIISQVVVLAEERRQNEIMQRLQEIRGVPNPQFFDPQREPTREPAREPANEIAAQIRTRWGWR